MADPRARPKVYVLDPCDPAGIAHAAEHADVVLWDDPAAARWHEDADGLMVRMRRLTAEDLYRAKRLRVVSKQGVGVETIDLDAARARGITVCNTPGVNSEAVAEMALVLALAVLRRVAEMDRAIRSGAAVDRSRFIGQESWGKTVGIVGMGNIGTRIARKWRGAFGAELLAYDPYVPADHWPDLPHRRVPSLDAMLPLVDVLTLHVPLTAETRHMVSGPQLARMRPSAIVVNVSRGGIVDETALAEALAGGGLFGAGLDVFEVEPPPADHPLVRLPNTVVTPHAAAGTRETQATSALRVAEQLIHVLAGGEPFHRVA